MKIFGRKIPKGNILVLISFAAISLCLIMIISLSRQDKLNNIMRKGLYTGNQKWFEINDCKDEAYWNNVLPDLAENYDDFAVYVDLPDPEISVRGIYVSGNVVIPPMLSGKYFDGVSSFGDAPKVVLGKEFEDKIVDRYGKSYFEYCGTECEVIGIMGTQKDSRINHMIVIDFMTALQYTGINTEYTYDVSDKDGVTDIGQYIYGKFESVSQVYMSLETEPGKASFVKFLFSVNTIMDTVYVMMLISFIVSTMLVTFIWFRERNTLFKAWELCGYKTKEIMLEVSKRYYAVSFSGFSVGLAAALFITKNMFNNKIEINDIIQAFVVTVGIGTIILACSMLRRTVRMHYSLSRFLQC